MRQLLLIAAIASMPSAVTAQTTGKPKTAWDQLKIQADQLGLDAGQATAQPPQAPGKPVEQPAPKKTVDIAIEGTGNIRGGGPVPVGFFGAADGSINVGGKIQVGGDGVIGEAKVSGVIHAESESYWSAERIEGCGEVHGTAELKDAIDGTPAGKVLVNGRVCVTGQAREVKIPFVGRQWIVAVQGTGTVKGVLKRAQ